MSSVLIHSSRLRGRMQLPPSKSEALRVILLAATGKQKCRICACSQPRCSDINAALSVAGALGAGICRYEDGFVLIPDECPPGGDCFVGECAAALRISLPLFLAEGIPIVYHMKPVLLKRVLPSLGTLAQELGTFTIDHSLTEDEATLSVRGRLPDRVHLTASETSQLISGFAMTLSLFPEVLRSVEVTSRIAGRKYFEMTLGLLKRFGCPLEERDGKLVRAEGSLQLPDCFTPSRDWSAAAVPLAMNCHGAQIELCCENPRDSLQGDSELVALFNRAGSELLWKNGLLKMLAPPCRPFGADCDDIPDIAPFLALAAASLHGESRLSGLRRLRCKESDRFSVSINILLHFGIDIFAPDEESWVISGGRPLHEGENCSGFGDHRMAMLAAATAFVSPGNTVIHGADCVEKSWPLFWNECALLGGNMEWLEE